MSTNEHQFMVDFKELREGMSLGGAYSLEHWIRNDDAGTFFSAVTDGGERLLVKLVPEQEPDAERQFASWQRSRHLRHPHLLDLRDVGRSELAGVNYIYGAFEYPDDTLASALEQGPLSEPETRGVLEAALAALRYLHGQGLVHGAVTPDHIVAVGENVKLTTDSLRESDDLEGHGEDVRLLGELVGRLRAPEPLSEPLATIARQATARDIKQRWTLAEIADFLEPPPVPPPAPVLLAAPPPPPVRGVEPEAGEPKSFPKWIFAGVAVLLFSILIFNLRRTPDAAPVVPVTPAAPQAAPAPPAAVEPLAPPRVNVPSRVSGAWRVIAFTYRSREMAAKKAIQINSRWPDLAATVFSPRQRRGYYLVALGDRTTREEAVRLQRRARRLGLPRDTFVQNYSE